METCGPPDSSSEVYEEEEEVLYEEEEEVCGDEEEEEEEEVESAVQDIGRTGVLNECFSWSAVCVCVVTLGLIPIGSLSGGLKEAEKTLVGAEVCSALQDSGRTGPARFD